MGKDRMPDELWTEIHDIVQDTGIKTIPKKNKCKKVKWLSEEALQIAVKIREVKNKGEKEKEPEIKLPTSAGSWKKQESSRKTSFSALLTSQSL